MTHYRFKLSDYKAIGNAEIDLNGITVIAGCNGSGKSTIARWLYAFVNYTNEFPELVDIRLIRNINNRLRQLHAIIDDIAIMTEHETKSFPRYRLRLSPSFLLKGDKGYDDIMSECESFLNNTCKILDERFGTLSSNEIPQWLLRHLKLPDNTSPDNWIRDFYERWMRIFNRLVSEASHMKQHRYIMDLAKQINDDMPDMRSWPSLMQLEEDGQPLIVNARFLTPLTLHNSIYVDTPMSIAYSNGTGNVIWEKLKIMLTSADIPRISPEHGRLIAMIQRIIGGQVKISDDTFNDEDELRYVRDDDNLNISVDEVATGMKSFVYLLRLIENGKLNSQSLLLIDEPEAHLHPQWIVEFARVLVMINKLIGSRILLASHNPDLIAAIQSISKAEGTSDTTCFYQAERIPGSQQFRFNALGNDIEPIFESFNIALDRIQEYGR